METYTTWFLYCEDAHSNEVVATALNGLHATVSDFKEYICTDGKRRHLYEVPDYTFASQLYRSQRQLGATLSIFRSQNQSKPDLWKFETKKKVSIATLLKKSDALKKKVL